jgi:hypothetical protein
MLTHMPPSVRISTTAKYNQGLWILDVEQAPWGCGTFSLYTLSEGSRGNDMAKLIYLSSGTWPAYWSTNENWPNDGEIDIIENVHSSQSNQVSWHTTAGALATLSSFTLFSLWSL